jgi:hypothetical protein
VTETPPRPPTDLPPDPAAYDSPRAQRAREKGLDAPYIAGGEAPDAAVARAEERRLGRILLVMVILIISAGFVLGAIAALVAPAGQ